MNYDVNKDTVFVKKLAFDGCQEIPVDLDFSLPDYCPDIQRILKCGIHPKVSTRNISGDRLNIDGNIDIKIIYVDSDKKSVRCCENTTSFSCSIDLRTSPENAVSIISSRIEYMNCRAVSPRKIDIHGAVAICAKVYNKSGQDIVYKIEGDDVQQKKSQEILSNLEGMGQQQFSISEMLDLGQNKPAPEIIIRSDISLIPKEYKNMVNKVAVKGEALVKILYIGDISSGQLEVMEYSIPFNQVIDVPGATDESQCTVCLEVLSHEEQIQGDEQGVSNFIMEDIKAAATIMAYGEKEIEMIKDAYSVNYDLEYTNEIIKLCRISQNIDSSFSVNGTIEFTEFNISRVIDIWSDVSSINGKYENGEILFEGKMNVCILAIDLEETPFYIERIIDVRHKKPLDSDCEEIIVESEICPTAIGYRITGSGSIEVKADINLNATVYTCKKHNTISGATASETQPQTKDSNAALTIYFAEPGETIWDIARKYYTYEDAIKEENDISEEVINQSRMILIPMS